MLLDWTSTASRMVPPVAPFVPTAASDEATDALAYPTAPPLDPIVALFVSTATPVAPPITPLAAPTTVATSGVARVAFLGME